MRKNVLHVIFALMVAITFPHYIVGASAEGLYEYEMKGNGTAIITKYHWERSEGNVNVPNMIDGYLVTEIGEEAFACEWPDDGRWQNCVSVTLPNTITTIRKKAFFGSCVNSINIPEDAKRIEDGAFTTYTNDMKFIVAPDHHTFTTVDGFLYNKNTKELVSASTHAPMNYIEYLIPDGIESIAGYAFYGTRIQSLSVPSSVTFVGEYAFAETETVVNPDLKINLANLRYIGEGAFLNAADIVDAIGELKFHPDITEISAYAFWGAFVGEVEFHADIHKIGKGAFAGAGLTDSFFPGLMEKDYTELTIPGTIREIGDDAFQSSSLKTVDLQDGVKRIGDRAFENTIKLEHIVIPQSVEYLGVRAFNNCSALVDVEIMGTSMVIGSEAFADNWQLSKVMIGDGVASIGCEAFAGCKNLDEVTISDDVVEIGEGAFDKAVTTLIVHRGSYAELWAQENGCAYTYFETETDLSWLEASNEEAVFIPGTYTASAEGRFGKNVIVTITFSETEIMQVEIDASGETAGFGQDAAKQLAKEIENKQSVQVDVFSGATITSDAILRAAEACYESARK